MQDKERPGQSKQFEDEELEALLDEDCCQTQEELAESLGVTQAAGYIQKQGNWVLHELKPRDVETVFTDCVRFLLPPWVPPAHCVFLIQPTSGSGARKKP